MHLTPKQQIRVDIITQYLSGQIFQEDACLAIGIQERQFRRLVKAFREEGIVSVLHGNTGRTPGNSISDNIKRMLIIMYKGRYKGLNLVHFIEKVKENHSGELPKTPCYSTIRNIFIKEKLLKPNQSKRKKAHCSRKRYSKEGLMIQIDGSHHHWLLNQPPCCLTAAIDDATGKMVGAKFTETETTFAAMDVIESIVKKYGCFQMLYSDKAGIYGGGKRDGYSNMNRAMKDLNIVSIQANSAQAKGRVERLFKTLQSRLIAELRLRRISTMDEANIYLKETFIEHFNKKFAKEATDQNSAYRHLHESINLDEVFTMRDDRVVQSGHIVSYGGDKYLVTSEKYSSLVKKHVEIRLYRNGNMKMFVENEEISFQLFSLNALAA
ncbi:MAG: ISNCY family transposase [Candidatus Brocadiales bacterium]|nr:ISNCY family transposase [Candidatus Brocadiales bacterium]